MSNYYDSFLNILHADVDDVSISSPRFIFFYKESFFAQHCEMPKMLDCLLIRFKSIFNAREKKLNGKRPFKVEKELTQTIDLTRHKR